MKPHDSVPPAQRPATRRRAAVVVLYALGAVLALGSLASLRAQTTILSQASLVAAQQQTTRAAIPPRPAARPAPVNARRPAPAGAPAAGSSQQGRPVNFKGRTWRREPDRPEGPFNILSGDVRFTFEDTTLRTDAATFNEKTQVAVAPGALQIDDALNTITASKGIAYYKKRRADLTGDVRIVARPRKEDANAPAGTLRGEFREPVTITCDQVQYNWRRRFAVATGNLTFKQKDRTVTADRVEYDARNEIARLIGNVRGVDRGREIRGDEAIIGLKAGSEYLQLMGNIGGVFRVEDDEETPGDEEAATPAIPAPPTGTGGGTTPGGGGGSNSPIPTTPPTPNNPPARP